MSARLMLESRFKGATMSIDPENPLAVEIRQEMANAYFAACKKMVDALEALRQFEREMPASSDSPQKPAVLNCSPKRASGSFTSSSSAKR